MITIVRLPGISLSRRPMNLGNRCDAWRGGTVRCGRAAWYSAWPNGARHFYHCASSQSKYKYGVERGIPETCIARTGAAPGAPPEGPTRRSWKSAWTSESLCLWLFSSSSNTTSSSSSVAGACTLCPVTTNLNDARAQCCCRSARPAGPCFGRRAEPAGCLGRMAGPADIALGRPDPKAGCNQSP